MFAVAPAVPASARGWLEGRQHPQPVTGVGAAAPSAALLVALAAALGGVVVDEEHRQRPESRVPALQDRHDAC